MSKFSGKCDFCDHIEISGLENVLQSEVYIGENTAPLKLTCLQDCIPYFPYVITRSATTNGKCRLWLTSKSWVAILEERYGKHEMHDHYRNLLQSEIEKNKIK